MISCHRQKYFAQKNNSLLVTTKNVYESANLWTIRVLLGNIMFNNTLQYAVCNLLFHHWVDILVCGANTHLWIRMVTQVAFCRQISILIHLSTRQNQRSWTIWLWGLRVRGGIQKKLITSEKKTCKMQNVKGKGKYWQQVNHQVTIFISKIIIIALWSILKIRLFAIFLFLLTHASRDHHWRQNSLLIAVCVKYIYRFSQQK